jgi:hypothetical protein
LRTWLRTCEHRVLVHLPDHPWPNWAILWLL